MKTLGRDEVLKFVESGPISMNDLVGKISEKHANTTTLQIKSVILSLISAGQLKLNKERTLEIVPGAVPQAV